jgi:cytochrome c
MISKLVFIVMTGGAILLALGTPDDVRRGQDLFVRRCSGCHSPDQNQEGPKLRGVYGRKAAGVQGFGYSEALKKLDVRWDEATLDRWLTDPEAMAPNTDMAFRLADKAERSAVIAWLKSLGN